MNSCDVYRALLKMKYMGYFKYTKAILVGRVLFKNVSDLIGYDQAFKKALPDIDVVFQVDIGHTYPHMYVVMVPWRVLRFVMVMDWFSIEWMHKEKEL